MTAVVIVLLLLNAVLVVGGILGFLWVRRELPALYQLVYALRPLTSETGNPTCSPIREHAPMDAKTALTFWQGVSAWPQWQRLAHLYQVETRAFLIQAKMCADAGNQSGALFMAGAAWDKSRIAVEPESRVATALRSLQIEAMEATRKSQQPERKGWPHIR